MKHIFLTLVIVGGMYLSAVGAQIVDYRGSGMVAGGGKHTLILRYDGTVWGVGYNAHGQLGIGSSSSPITLPQKTAILSNVVFVAGGGNHSMAITTNGALWTWGYNTHKELGLGFSPATNQPGLVSTLSNVCWAAGGENHSLAVTTNGTVWVWGDNTYRQLGFGTADQPLPLQLTTLSNIVRVAAGSFHSLALDASGRVWAWGKNTYGQIGNGISGTGEKQDTPFLISNLTNIVAIAAGVDHSVALRNDGTIWTCGYNQYGQLGDGTETDADFPVQVFGISGAIYLDCGEYHTTAVTADGSVWTWGLNTSGELGDNSTANHSFARRVNSLSRDQVNGIPDEAGALIVGAGDRHTIALKSDGTIWTWGLNDQGQLGTSNLVTQTAPVLIDFKLDPNFSPIPFYVGLQDGRTNGMVAAGYQFTLALNQAGTILGMGDNHYGQLGTNFPTDADHSVVVTNGFAHIAAGVYHSLAIDTNRQLYTWGNNTSGELGDGTTTDRHTPKLITTITGVVCVAGGRSHSLALKSDGTVWAWGDNSKSQLGTTSSSDSKTPAPVNGLRGIVAIAAGGYHNLALSANGTAWAWGTNAYGQLGNGTTTESRGPVRVSIGEAIRGIAAGYYYSVALGASGNVYCWGWNENGQLGDGTAVTRNSPIQVLGLNGVMLINAGQSSTFAMKTNHSIWAWGDDYYGKLGTFGDFSLSGSLNPRPVEVLATRRDLTSISDENQTGILQVSGGSYHTVMLKEDGSVWGTGGNASGELEVEPGYYRRILKQLSLNLRTNPPVDTFAVTNYSKRTLAAGLTHSLVIKPDGTMVAWGENSDGRLGNTTTVDSSVAVPVTNLTAVLEISAGDTHSLAIVTNPPYFTDVYAWGGNANGQLGQNDLSSRSVPQIIHFAFATSVAAGGSHSLVAMKENWLGQVYAWGNCSYGQLGFGVSSGNYKTPQLVPGVSNILMVAAGWRHSLLLKTDGTVWACGYNNWGQLGDGLFIDRSSFVPVNGLRGVVAIAAGKQHSLALKADGTVWAWGDNTSGQTGQGTSGDYRNPAVQVLGIQNVIRIAAGDSYSLAEKADGTIWAWGKNTAGQLGAGVGANQTIPVEIWGPSRTTLNSSDSAGVGIAAGGSHALAWKADGSVWSWGENSSGQLGTGNALDEPFPSLVNGFDNVTNSFQNLFTSQTIVAAGSHHSLAVRSDGSVWSWGRNQLAQLGVVTNASAITNQTRIAALTNVISVSSTFNHSLAVQAGGALWAWGNNAYQQLGINSAVPYTNAPQQVSISPVRQVAAGSNHTVAIKNNGTLWAWGHNADYQLGDGTTTARPTPVQIQSGTFVNSAKVAAGAMHTVLMDSNGVVYTWGDNSLSQIGNGTTGGDQTSPATISAVGKTVDIAAGQFHTLALNTNGTVWAWGNNADGQLGIGSLTSTNQPVRVNGLYGVVAIAAVGNTSFALRWDNTLWAWGKNDLGQLGIDSTGDQLVPARVIRGSDIIGVAPGGNHTLAMTKTGQVLAWGSTNYGQLGNRVATAQPGIPDAVMRMLTLKEFVPTYQDPLSGGAINRYAPSSEAHFGRFEIGSSPEAMSSIETLDWQKGVTLSNDFARHFPAALTNNLTAAWTLGQHYNKLNETSSIPVKAPLAAFGSLVGGSKLLANKPQSFRVHFGVIGGGEEAALRIKSYNPSDGSLVASNIIALPSETNAVMFQDFVQNGLVATPFSGVEVTIRFDDFGLTDALPDYSYSPLWISISCNFPGMFEIQGRASVETPRFYAPFQRQLMVTNSEGNWSRLCVLNFDSPQAWQTELTEVPHLSGEPVPPSYYGKTRGELQAVHPEWPTLPPLTNATERLRYLQLNQSPELRVHPDLTNFVNDLGRDPLALANYVINEIDFTDLKDVQLGPDGPLTRITGVNRGAWGTFQEQQGSAIEQCGLLVCLLRIAGVPAVYVFPTNDGMKMLTFRINDLVGFPLFTNDVIHPEQTSVNYPWVAAWVGDRWVHIFPWIKDVKLELGLPLYDYMPEEYNNGYKWMVRFMEHDTNIMFLSAESDQPLVLWPKFVEKKLLDHPGISIDDIGIKRQKSTRQYQDWSDLPQPFAIGSDVATLESLSLIPGIFNQVEIAAIHLSTGVSYNTGKYLVADLHNRPLTIIRTSDTSNHEFRMAPVFDSAQPAQTFPLLDPFGIEAWAERKDGTITLSSGDALTIAYDKVSPLRVRGLPREWAFGNGASRETQVFTNNYNWYGAHAISLNLGRVTKRMLDVQARELWKHRDDTKHGATPEKSIYRGLVMFLMGQTYWEYNGRFADLNYRLHGIRPTAVEGHLVACLQPGTSGKYEPRIDASYHSSRFIYNADLPGYGDGGDNFSLYSYGMMQVAQGSSAEHGILASFLRDTNAVSTFSLLQKLDPASIVRVNQNNYVELGEKQFGTKKLSAWDPQIWARVVKAMSTPIPNVQAFLTPGEMTNGTFKGMGALILSDGSREALISGLANGGVASQFPTAYMTWSANLASYDLLPVSGDLNGTYEVRVQDEDAAVRRLVSQVCYQNISSTWDGFLNGSLMLDSFAQDMLKRARAGGFFTPVPVPDELSDIKYLLENGYLGPSRFNGYQAIFTEDPVSVISGEFYVDDVDIALPGPMPIEVRRTYSSHNESLNLFGYGWQLGYMPFLTFNTNKSVFYAAEMDGSVVAYASNSPAVWRPTFQQNPKLNNRNHGAPGSVGNLFNARIEMTTTNAQTNYYLFGADGSLRHYRVQKFPIQGTNSTDIIQRERPYLQSWRDSRTNGYTFSYGTDTNRNDYGQLRRIESNNGNFIGFYYDYYGHITEAFTGDGRRLKYDYDALGDLVQVTRPDDSSINFEYEHKSIVTNASETSSVQVTNYYSTHLMTYEIKPDGRTLFNQYDAHRRVTNQWSTVGPDLRLVRNATFIYSNNFNLAALTNETALTNTISGFTTVIDVNTNLTHYGYTNGLLAKVIEALNQPDISRTNITDWYFPGDASAGAYPRSVKRIVDARGLETTYSYDSSGNLTNAATAGDLTGSGYASNAVTRYSYNAINLLTNIVDPMGNRTVYYYDAAYPYVHAADVTLSGSTVIASNVFEYYSVTNGPTNSLGLLRRKIVAIDTADAATNEWLHDARGFVLQEIGYSGTSDSSITNFFHYTARGEIFEQYNTAGRTNRFDHDGMGRQRAKEVIDESGTQVSADYSYYNENGELTWSDGPKYDPEDYVWRDYDGAGRLIEEVRWRTAADADGSGVSASLGEELFSPTFHQYDGFGNRTRSTDALGHYSLLTYDVLGRVVTYKAYGANGAVLSTNGFKYEVGGQPTNEFNPLGGVTRKFYTQSGKLRRQENADSSVMEWRYTLTGRVQKEFLPNGAYWETEYEDASRKITRTFKTSGGTALATNLQYTDRRGNVVTNVDLLGNQFVTTYDKLNRVKTTRGPGTNARITTQVYDGSGKILIVSNALAEQTYTFVDALGRPLTNEVRKATGEVVRRTSISYGTNHHSVTTTEGSGADAIKTIVWTDTFGQPVLTQKYTNGSSYVFTLNAYDFLGNLISSRDERGRTNTILYDGLHRPVTNIMPDGATVTLGYNAASSITNRTMPGGLKWSAGYDSANRMTAQELTGGAVTSRRSTYAYYTTGPVGMLQTVTDPRNNTGTHSYDAFLRLTGTVVSGTQTLTNGFGLDLLGRMTNSYQLAGTNVPVEVSRQYDAYGEATAETIRINGVVSQQYAQGWDAAGRRTNFSAPGGWFNQQFSYRADGLMAGLSDAGGNSSTFTYLDNGLPVSRSNPWRTLTVHQRDGRGRVLTQTTTAAAVTALAETNSWLPDSSLANYTVRRSENGGWLDARGFGYSTRNFLTNEMFSPISGQSASNAYAFSSDKLGVRTTAIYRNSTLNFSNMWQASSLNGLAEAINESTPIGRVNLRSEGRLFNTNQIWISLDGVSVSGLHLEELGQLNRWTTDLELTPGTHSLRASTYSEQSFRGYNSVTNQFVIDTGLGASTTNLYDAAGQLIYRRLGGATYQTLSWDSAGRLTAIYQTDNTNGFYWSALYDGSGRRLRTHYTSFQNNSNAPTVITDSGFDPAVEFLEITVMVNGQRTWKTYGPDASRSYGGAQGIGGLESTRRDGDGVVIGAVQDQSGTIVASVYGSTLVWQPNRYTGYGPVQGYEPLALGENTPLAEVLVWQGRRIDPSGYYWMGARYYDSRSGRFLSPDPLGHEECMDLYSYAHGDPVNGMDPDGRGNNPAFRSAVEFQAYLNTKDHVHQMMALQQEAMQIEAETRVYQELGRIYRDIAYDATLTLIVRNAQAEVIDRQAMDAARARQDYLSPGLSFAERLRYNPASILYDFMPEQDSGLSYAQKWKYDPTRSFEELMSTSGRVVGEAALFAVPALGPTRLARFGLREEVSGVVTGLRSRGALEGITLTGETASGLNRVSAEWRSLYGPSAMRRHHLVPQEMLSEPAFLQRMGNLGYTPDEAVRFVNRQIADMPNVAHMRIHAEGWNATWRVWLTRNPNFAISDIRSQTRAMMQEFEIPRASLGGPRYGRR